MADAIPPQQINQDQETRVDADEAPQSSKFWLGEIAASEKRYETWVKRAERVVKRFRDEREKETFDAKRANILWSNTEVLKAALFQGLGQPDVRRRFPKRGQDERAARTAAMVIERGLSYCQDAYDLDTQIESCVEDMLLPGRGTSWVVYEADTEDVDPEIEGEVEYQTEPMTQIVDQRVGLEHVYWKDFLTSAGRKWSDVWWVARRHVYTRDELVENFGEEHGKAIPLGAEIDDRLPTKERDDTFKRSNVWEIWDKSKKQRVYVAEGYDFVLKSDDDPYKLQRFYPCPEPLYGIKTTSSLLPVPEFTLYQDQADELDTITTRLHNLVDALRRRGIYDASEEGGDNKLSQLAHLKDNQFVPYKGFAGLMEKGGLKNVFQVEDLTPTIAVVDKLYIHRQTLVQTIYEVTGISDVLRGSSNPNETATAQKIKGQFGSLRLQKRQSAVQRFIRDAFRLKAEIIAEHFTREKLIEMTGLEMPSDQEIAQAQQVMQQVQAAQQAQAQQQMQPPQPGQPPMAQQQAAPPPVMPAPQAVQRAQEVLKQVPWSQIEPILRSDERRGYKIDIETDATARVDEQEEKAARIEFVTSMQAFLERSLPAAMAQPALMPLIRELTSFSVKAFKIGRSMEEAFDDAFDQLAKQAAQSQQAGPPVDPKAQAEAEKLKAETATEQARTQREQQAAKTDAMAAASKQQADALKARTEQTQAEAEMARDNQRFQVEMVGKVNDIRQSAIKAAMLNGAVQ